MTNKPNPNSKRTKRRKNRLENPVRHKAPKNMVLVGEGSRPNRRAQTRQLIALAGYAGAVRSDRRFQGRGYKKPGSQKRW